MQRNAQQLRKNLEEITRRIEGGSSPLEQAQNDNNQKLLDSYYQVALDFFKESAKENGMQFNNSIGFDPTLVDSTTDQRTILYYAIACFQPEKEIKQLIKEGSKTSECYRENFESKSAFFTALSINNIVATKTLLEMNPDLSSSKHAQFKMSAANYLVQENKLELLKVLLKTNPNIANISKDSPGLAPLHVAATYGRATMTALLLQKGAERDQETTKKQTAFQIAANAGHDNVVRTLLQYGARQTKEHRIFPANLNTHTITAIDLKTYIDQRTGQGRFTNPLTNAFFDYTGYSLSYDINDKRAVATKVVTNILEKNMKDPLSNLDDNDMKILNDSRTGEIAKQLIADHNAILEAENNNNKQSHVSKQRLG